MSGSKVSAEGGSAAVGGNVNAPVINVNADKDASVSITVDHNIARELPSFLGAVIAVFSSQSLSEYGLGPRRVLSAEVVDKLAHNMLPESHHLIKEYNRYVLLLDQAYLGIEQRNADARFLVRRKAGIAYQMEIAEICKGIPAAKLIECVRANVDHIIGKVTKRLLDDYKGSDNTKVEEEIAHLAVSLIVADAIVECEVLERP